MYILERSGLFYKEKVEELDRYANTPTPRMKFEREIADAKELQDFEIAGWGLVPGMRLRKIYDANGKIKARLLSDVEHAQLQIKYLRRKGYSNKQIKTLCNVKGCEMLTRFLTEPYNLRPERRQNIIQNLRNYEELRDWNYD